MSSQSSDSALIHYHGQFMKATELYNFVNLTTKCVIPNFKFEARQAMVDAAIPDSLAASQAFSNKFNECLYAVMNQNRYKTFDLPTSEKILVENLKKIIQILHPHIPSEAMHLFLLAGFNMKVKKTDEGKIDRKDYDRVIKKMRRALNAFKQSYPAPSPIATLDTPAPLLGPPVPFINSITTPSAGSSNINGRTINIPPATSDEEFNQTLSPMTTNQRNSTGDSSTISSLTAQGQRSQANRSTTTIQSERQRGIASTIHNSTDSTSTDVFGDIIPRQTSTQTQSSRRYNEKEKNTRILGFKIGTTLYDEKLKGNNLVGHLQSEDEIADGINRLLGIDVICGREIKRAVTQQNRVGLAPLTRGRHTELSREDIEDLAILFFSISSIEQANASTRLKRPQLISLLDQIVNEKRRNEGNNELNATSLYKYHIEPLNSLRQDMNPVDRREFIRVLWLTYKNLQLNYKRWEEACIQEGFARPAETEEELQEHGRIVFYDGKFSSRFMNFDEMQLSLDQNNERPGGRPADTPTNPSISDPGSGQYKSGAYCTIVASIVGNEPGIPLFIFPTQAKSGEVNVYPKRLESFPQIKAKYGNTFARWYDVNIQFSPKGSMNSSIMGHWVQGLSEYYPDVADEPGKRVIVKSDSGPGRLKNEKFMNNLLMDGFKFFASLPNGTEITQEMDQLFAEFKRLCYLNRDQLFEALVSVYGPKAKLTLDHVGYIVFGGEVEIQLGTTVTIKYKPFIEAFTPDKIKSAREGCGFWPFTQNALKSRKVRHVLKAYKQSVHRSDDSDTNSDDDSQVGNISNGEEEGILSTDEDGNIDVQEELLASIEDLNAKTVDILVGKGYHNVAELGTRKLIRDSDHNEDTIDNEFEQSYIIRTEPNTIERQNQLASVRNAGEFHKITMGGSILNCPDMMIGMARKRMKKDAEALEKEKKAIQAYGKIADQACTTVFSKQYATWTAKDFKLAIKFKQGLKAPNDRKWNQTWKIVELRAFYEENYKGRPRLGPDQICWTAEDEAKLERMKTGTIDSVQETVSYGRCLEGRKSYLVQRLMNLSAESRFDVLEDVTLLLTSEERNKLGLKLGFGTALAYGNESDSEDDDNESIDNSFSPSPIPRFISEIIEDHQEITSQDSSEEDEDIVQFNEDHVDNEESVDGGGCKKKNRSTSKNDDQSDQSFESLFDSSPNQESNNLVDSGDSNSDSSSCFNFQQTNKKANDDNISPLMESAGCNPPPTGHTRQIVSDADDVAEEDIEEGDIEDNAISCSSSLHQNENSSEHRSTASGDETNGNEDDMSEASVYVRMSQITTEKDGVTLIKDELNARGIEYDDNWKIRKLKNVLINDGLNGEKEFKPKSSLIMQAIDNELI